MTSDTEPSIHIDRRDLQPALILLLATLLLIVWVYYGKQANFEQLRSSLLGQSDRDIYSTIYEYLVAFFLMFCIPAAVVKLAFKSDLGAFGLRWGNTRHGLRIVALALPLLLCAVYVGSGTSAIQAEYPLARSAMGSPFLYLAVEIFYLLFYLGWEFLFRGFMLFGVAERYDAVLAIVIQTMASTLVHIGKPASETFAAILAGLAFGYLALRTRSILYPLILHAVVGIGTNLCVTLRLTG